MTQINNQINNLKNLRTFEVLYLRGTSRGSRVKINDLRHNQSVIIPYDHELNNIYDMANEYLYVKHGIICLFKSESKRGYLLHTHNFETKLKTGAQK